MLLPCLSYVLLSLFVVLQAAAYTLKKVEIKKSIDGKEMRIFTDEEIAKHNGEDASKPLYMAIKGVVFDVSSGNAFYGKGAGYNSLTGKDCSRAVGKMSLDEEDLTSDLSGLDDETLKALDDVFEKTYMTKYPIAGYMAYLTEEQGTAHDDL